MSSVSSVKRMLRSPPSKVYRCAFEEQEELYEIAAEALACEGALASEGACHGVDGAPGCDGGDGVGECEPLDEVDDIVLELSQSHENETDSVVDGGEFAHSQRHHSSSNSSCASTSTRSPDHLEKFLSTKENHSAAAPSKKNTYNVRSFTVQKI